ncbi:MAG: sigma-70 family RNA polymerase sigma factor [Gemmataceae bacterium]|nr:sigma-70 family RNA polymerase sigma factor [Gemmataceae bacterium]
MPDESLDTLFLNKQIALIREGDRAARNEVIRRAQRRLERIAKRMIRNFPNVNRWANFEDVLQNALIRLLRALETVTPTSTREFYGLAARQIRRELIDMARSLSGPHGLAANHASGALIPKNGDPPSSVEPADMRIGDDLDRWRAFHEAVELLPVEEREVFGLIYYHGWKQAQIAELFGKDERTVRRWYTAACARLKERLQGDWTDPE